MSDANIHNSDRVVELADEYLDRARAGESVSVADYAEEYPDLAEAIRQYLPMVEMMEAAAAGETQHTERSIDTSVGDARERQSSGQESREVAIPDEFGRYRVERLLGRGAMGAVWLALDTQLDRRVAIKVPQFGDGDTTAIERFNREVRSMATVQHANLCPVYDVGEIQGRQYLTMAFVDGPTLSEYRQARGATLSEREAAGIVAKLARALHVAHQAGVVHRDLKPSNVMINAEGEPVVMDFGLARRRRDGEAEITHDGAIVGSPAYMAPEQIDEASQVGPQADVYALGIILYELLTGQRPFEGPVLSVLGQIANGEPPRLSTLRPEIDPELERICLKAIARSLDDRYTSAAELAAGLERYLGTQAAMPDARTSQMDRVRGTSRSRRLVPIAIALAAFAVVVSYLVRTPYGDVIVHAPKDVNVEIVISQKGEVVDVVGPDDGWRVRVKAGSYEMSLRPVDGKPVGAQTTLTLKGGNVLVVSRGDRADVTIERRPRVRETAAADGEPVGDATVEVSRRRPDTSHLLPRLPVATTKSSGQFSDSGQRLGQGTYSRAAELGDLDGDGDLDAFVGCGGEQPNRVWLNDGKGRFSDSEQRLGEGESTGVSLGDVDGDGDLDAAVGNHHFPSRLWLNDGDGQFTDSEQDFDAARHIALGDLDADGDLDLFVTRAPQPNLVLWNDGKGHFTNSGQRLGNSSGVFTALGDIDNDSDLDAYVCNKARGADVLYVNDGTGRFQASPQRLSGAETNRAVLTDWDSDGSLDVVLCGFESGVELWLNDGRGNLTPETVVRARLPWNDIRVADTNGDSEPLVLAPTGFLHPEPMFFWRRQLQGLSQQPEYFGFSCAYAAPVGDLDGDGDLDVFVANREAADEVWFNRDLDEPLVPLFVKSELQIPEIESPSGEGERADLDGDGDQDVVVTVADGPDLIRINDGDGNFVTRQELPGDNSRGATTGDFDGDGHVDIVVLADESRIWLNDGVGVFKPGPVGLVTQRSIAVASADLNGDGHLDLAFAAGGFPYPKHGLVFFNDGQARFRLSAQKLSDLPPHDVALGDVDQDGDVDIVVANAGLPTQLLLNDGKGWFTHTQWLGINARKTRLEDLDSDGDLDLIELADDHSRVWLNQTAQAADR